MTVNIEKCKGYLQQSHYFCVSLFSMSVESARADLETKIAVC